MVGGVLYTTRGIPSQRRRRSTPRQAKRCGATGSTKARAAIARRAASHRGVGYWTDGKAGAHHPRHPRLSAGVARREDRPPDPAFGKNGVVDLYQDFDQPPPLDGVISSTSPAVVVRNVIVIGAAMVGGTAPRSKENTKGHIRGFDVRTGKRLWTFHTIPQPGEFGNDTWLNDSWSYTGNTGVWSPVLGRRRARLCVPAGRVGDRRLLRRPPAGQQPVRRQPRVPRRAGPASASGISQLVHHDIWDYDLASPPTLINITVNGEADPRRRAGRRSRAICSPSIASTARPCGRSKSGQVEAARCPASGTRRRSRTRPNRRPTIARACRKQDLIDFTPELNARSAGDAEGIQDRSAVHAADRRRHRRTAGDAADSRGAGRGALAGRGVGSRNAHAVCAVGDEHDAEHRCSPAPIAPT